jgi:predicted O-methyltransferase YrrM
MDMKKILKKHLGANKFLIPLYRRYKIYKDYQQKNKLRYRQIYEILSDNIIKNIMEIGVWNGFQAFHMIKICFKHSKNVNYFGFDLFEEMNDQKYIEELAKRPPHSQEVLKLLNRTKANIHLYKGDTQVTLPKHLDKLPVMDFVFIDGGHSLKTIRNDWSYVKELMEKNTIVIFDDYWIEDLQQGCKKLIDGLDRERYKIEFLPVIDTFDKKNHPLKIQMVKVNLK